MIELLQRAEVPSRAEPPHILVAEDDDEMRSLVAGALRDDGHDVTEAGDGGRMLVRLARAYGGATPYDLLVSDVRMPVCSGLQILESLRLARWHTPFILMTAFGDEQTRARAESLGATVFMKPFDMDDLRAAVLRLLGTRRAHALHG
jgi:DNA-binding response OmpR family regulator